MLLYANYDFSLLDQHHHQHKTIDDRFGGHRYTVTHTACFFGYINHRFNFAQQTCITELVMIVCEIMAKMAKKGVCMLIHRAYRNLGPKHYVLCTTVGL